MKVGSDTETAAGYIAAGQALTYRIYFENLTNATLPAQEVVVTDNLSTNLDWSTLQLQTIGFSRTAVNIPSGVQTFNSLVKVPTDPNPVQVSASLNPLTGQMSWDIKTVNPVTGQLVEDPLAGFLPPDDAQGSGDGFVSYTILPKAGLPTGSVIYNQASIGFDVNPPISTDVVTNTIDATPPTSAMTPLPAVTDRNSFPVSWSGADQGSGIGGFDIYVSTNGGAWAPWLLATTNRSATFTGVSGSTYAFYSVAVDQVGNVELSPIIPGAQTTLHVVQAPELSHPAWTDGQFQFTLNMTSTNLFVVQASTDLKSWISLQTNQAPFTFVDTNLARARWRFYRTLTLP